MGSISHWKHFKSKLIHQFSSFLYQAMTGFQLKGIELSERTLDTYFTLLVHAQMGLNQFQHVCDAFFSSHKFSYATFQNVWCPQAVRDLLYYHLIMSLEKLVAFCISHTAVVSRLWTSPKSPLIFLVYKSIPFKSQISPVKINLMNCTGIS